MQARVLIFYALQLTASLYALRRGGGPERWTAWMMAGAAVLSSLLASGVSTSFESVNPALLAIDLALLFGISALAARANRFWPMWVAALQLLAIGLHIIRGIDPTILPAVYNRTVGKIAYPMILLLVAGTARHSRRERAGGEYDWSPNKW